MSRSGHSPGYILCGTPRTGSTLLCSLLSSTGVLGRPESYFREPDEATWSRRLGVGLEGDRARDYAVFVHAVGKAGRTSNDIFGARIMWGSVERIVEGLRAQAQSASVDGRSDVEVLERGLGPLVFVHLRRPDVVGQAVSWCRAEQTGFWQDGDAAHRAPHEDLARSRGWVGTIEEHNTAWRSWFDRHGVRPLEVTYEQVVADPRSVVERTADHVGVDLPRSWEPVPAHRKQADGLNRRWVEALRDALGSGPEEDGRG